MSNKPSSFVTTVDVSVGSKLRSDLEQQGFEISNPPHTLFSAKSKGVSCTLYQSGKLVVQGKNMDSFIEFYLEPEILQAFTYGYEMEMTDQTPHIGIDESGKGDFFGPLCIAGVYAEGNQFAKLKEIGVKDSKAMTDATIFKVADKIKGICAYHIVKINPEKYNELYAQFKNLNRLLAWGHATTIEHLVKKTQCLTVIIDQFANEHVVLTALKRKNLEVALTQRHRAEEDLVVAAASILARETFLHGLNQLSDKYGIKLPKGASSAVIKAGKEIVRKHGQGVLNLTAKLHFKTLDAIIEKSENLHD